MSESTQAGNDNTKTNDLTTTDEALIQTNLDAEAAEPQSNQSESFLHQDEIQMTLKEFTQKLRDNDRSIKRIEESMAALYDKLERTPEMAKSKDSTKKKSKKGKKEKKLDKKGKKEKKLDKKGKKEKKLDKKGKKKSGKMKSGKKTKLARAKSSPEKKNTRLTNSKGKKGRMKNAANKK